MKQFGLIIALAAIALGLYNSWQLSQVRQKYAMLQGKPSNVAAAVNATQEPGLQDLLTNAQYHSARSKKLLNQGDYKGARTEMQKSLEAIQKARNLTNNQSGGIQDKLSSAQDKIQILLGRLESAGKNGINKTK
jgi:FtsZ-binding cell division protein ZapB